MLFWVWPPERSNEGASSPDGSNPGNHTRLTAAAPTTADTVEPGSPDGGAPLRLEPARVAAALEALGASATPEQVARAREGLLREELLLDEARRLGVDRQDPEVRARLVRVMRAVVEGGVAEPSLPQLEAWLAANPTSFARPEKLTLEHVYFRAAANAADDAANDAARAERAATALRSGAASAGLGDRHAIAGAPSQRTIDQLRAVLGPQLAERLRTAGLGEWLGPWESPSGLHLFRVHQRQDPGVPPVAEILDAVRSAWLAQQRAARLEAWVDARRERFQ